MTEQGSLGIVETQYYTFAASSDKLELESGEHFGPITLAYETYGEMNGDKSNAILVVHALSGDAHVAGRHSQEDRKPGWWDSLVGPGKGFDTNQYFVICSNVIGGCGGSTGPASENPETGQPYGLSFPVITIGDMVKAQCELVRHLGIEKLACVTGGSMGGMQTLEWMIRYPDMVNSAIVVASTHISGAQAIAFDAVGRNAIEADPAFDNGAYYGKGRPERGLSIARMLAHITYLSDESMRFKFGRTLREGQDFRYEFGSEFSVETYLDYQGEQFVDRFDANSYLYITKALDYFDVSKGSNSLDEAMSAAQGKVLVLSFSSDWLYPPAQSEELVYALARERKDVSYCSIKTDYGHDAFLLESEVMTKLFSGFLNHVRPEDMTASMSVADETATRKEWQKSGRNDYDLIVEMVEDESRVLDIGCGDGKLLHRLSREKNIHGLGIELDQDNVVRCVERGISVVQADADKGLGELPDQSFDLVILSMTLQVIQKPDLVIREMTRVGKKCIVSFPNFGHWAIRSQVLLSGHAPKNRVLSYEWYNSPNMHVLTLKDFRKFCAAQGVRIEREVPLKRLGVGKFWPNLFAEEVVCVVSGD
jgi:homoserine O-acetyltransferase